MIRSKILNVAVALLGGVLVAFASLAFFEPDAWRNPPSLLPSVFIAALGAWCLFGALSNLRKRLETASKVLDSTYRAAAVLVAIFVVCLLGVIASVVFYAKNNDQIFWHLALVFGNGLLLSFLAACGILLVHRLRKSARNGGAA